MRPAILLALVSVFAGLALDITVPIVVLLACVLAERVGMMVIERREARA